MDRPTKWLGGTLVPFSDDDMAQWQADQAAAQAAANAPKQAPDSPSLSDWRTGLVLWGRLDQVDGAITALKGNADTAKATLGRVAEQRFQFANNVFRAQLMAFKDMLGFTAADVEESLWRADRVAKGDLSGQWPVAA